MMAPVCIKLHNFKKFKVEHEGQLYELAATSSENLLSEFQKYKPEVKQLLVARPIVAEDFENLAEGSVVFASTQSYITEAQMKSGELHHHPPHNHDLAIKEYRSPSSTQCMALVNYSPTVCQSQFSSTKLRTDLSMVESYCPAPSGFIEAPTDPGPFDTIDVARRVRDILERHKISQTLFSKYVILRSQGTTSDLLRSPKPWDRMSEEGRTPYRRMKAWLEGDLTHNIQVLIQIKNGHDVLPAAQFTPKGLRTKFTDEQREALERFFSQNPRLTHDTLEEFANEQNLTVSAVRNWVNNRKQRLKRTSSSNVEEIEAKIPKTVVKVVGLETDDARGSGNEEVNAREVNGNGNEFSPNALPSMINGPTFKQERDSDSDQKCAQGSVFHSSSGIPTMVESLGMDCLGNPAE